MLTTPYIQYDYKYSTGIIFDAREEYLLKFTSIGGDQIFKNELVITDTDTNSIVYSKIIESFQLEHIIPSGTLRNAKEYKVKVRTYNINNDTSSWSDNEIISCFKKPKMGITNLELDKNNESIIRNQTYTFKAMTLDDEDDSIQSYRFLLYDYEKSLLEMSPSFFDSKFQYEFTGLKNEKKYYIEIKAITQHNVYVTSGLKEFTPVYLKPKVKNLTKLTNDYENALIHIETNIIQIIFRVLSGTISYENGEWINLENGSIIAEPDDGFELHGNWTLKMYVKDLKDDVPFLILSDRQGGKIDFRMRNNKIHIFKTRGDLIYHIFTKPLNNIDWSNNTLVIFVQKIGEHMNIKAEKMKLN
ncbi:hypothetical protein IRP61_11105 (plasmid) [Clostridium botulinum]|nr:hypothetical protein [Clostridium botulinum]QPW56421.1 hypothetical protein IRP61_11105 [Clostridium botulinum]